MNGDDYVRSWSSRVSARIRSEKDTPASTMVGSLAVVVTWFLGLFGVQGRVERPGAPIIHRAFGQGLKAA
jgi:hypothetical protein